MTVTPELEKKVDAGQGTPEENQAVQDFRMKMALARQRPATNERPQTPTSELGKPRTLADIPEKRASDDEPNAIFRNGYLRRKQTATLVSTSGVGKSVIVNQSALSWSQGEAGILGVEPVRPLRIALIQAEDDDEEVGEILFNMRKGYLASGWTDAKFDKAKNAVIDESPNFKGLTGDTFVEKLKAIFTARPVDLIVINPLQSYAGIDISKNAELSEFLRAKLQPAIEKTNCGCLIIHHTNKPPSAPERKGWGTDEMAAYIGAGGAELVNYVRGIISIMPTSKDGYFWLIGAKRGTRLGWIDATGQPTKKRVIAYSKDGLIFWREPDAEEIKKAGLVKKDAATVKVEPKKPGRKREGDEEADGKKLAELLRHDPMTRMEMRNKAENLFSSKPGERAYNWVVHNLKKLGLVEGRNAAGYAAIGAPDLFGNISQN